MDSKLCRKCGAIKPRDDFYVAKHAKTGMSSYCKVCSRIFNGAAQQKVRAALKALRPLKAGWPEGTRGCTQCGEVKPFSEFYNHAGGRWGKRSWCKQCDVLKARRQYGLKTRDRHRKYERRRLYGMEPEEYDGLLRKQGGVCAICGVAPAAGAALCVDHCHHSKVIRGLLCRRCNIAIGHFGDHPGVIENALRYLERARDFGDQRNLLIQPGDSGSDRGGMGKLSN